MKKIILFTFLVSCFLTVKSQTDSSNISFEVLLDSAQMVFTPPKGYVEITPTENNQMNYEKAYKHTTEKFEVRYAIRRHNFKFFESIFQMTLLNITDGQMYEYNFFNPNAVKTEFHGDIGASVLVKPGEEFAKEYKYCLMVCVNKKGIGDMYCFYLGDDTALITKLMKPIFYALKFKEKTPTEK